MISSRAFHNIMMNFRRLSLVRGRFTFSGVATATNSNARSRRRIRRPWEWATLPSTTQDGCWKQQHQRQHQLISFSSYTSIPYLTANFSPSDSSKNYNDDATNIKPYLWDEMHRAVETCDGLKAEEIADQIIIQHQHRQQQHRQHQKSTTIDGKVFSLVLKAWRNQLLQRIENTKPSTKKERKEHLLHMQDIAMRSHKVLQQMIALSDNGILSGECYHPTLKDYARVLECWYETTKFASNVAHSYQDKLAKKCVHYGANHAQQLWKLFTHQISSDTTVESMSNSSLMIPSSAMNDDYHAMKDIRSKQKIRNSEDDQHLLESQENTSIPMTILYMKILEFDGRASTAENVLDDLTTNQDSVCFDDEQILELCYCVLRAHSNSPETKAADFAHCFLRRMHTSPDLPNPTTTCYNILFEQWKRYRQQGRFDRDQKKQLQRNQFAADKMDTLLKEMKNERVRPDLMSYKYVIGALSTAGEAIRAERVLTQLLKDYIEQFDATLKPDIEPFESVLWSYSLGRGSVDAKTAERAESLVSNMKQLYECGLLDVQPNVWCYNICLKIWSQCKSQDALDRALDLYERMQLPVTPADDGDSSDDTESNSTDTYSKTGSQNFPRNEPRESRGVMPDSTSINTILSISRSGCAEETEKLLFRFLDDYKLDPISKPRPDIISFSTAISTWIRSNHKDAPLRAERLLQLLQQLCENGTVGGRPDVVCYGAVMQAWAASKRPEAMERAEAILRLLLESNDRKPDVVCWNSAIAAAGSAGMGLKAEKLFREMLDLHLADSTSFVSPNAISFTNVLNALAKTRWSRKRCEGAAKASVQLLKEIEELSLDGVLSFQPSIIHYSIVMDCLAYAKLRETAELAESMLRRLSDSNQEDLKPNTITFNAVLKAWSFLREPDAVDKVMGLMNEMIHLSKNESNTRVRPNSNTFGSVLHALANSWLDDKDVRAMEIVRLMDNYGFVCDEWCNKELSKCLSTKNSASSTRQKNKKSSSCQTKTQGNTGVRRSE